MKRWQSIIGRREFMKWSLAGGTTLLMQSSLGKIHSALAQVAPKATSPSTTKHHEFLLKFGPMDRTLGDHAPKTFFGDDNSRPHKALWNLPQYLEGKKVEGTTEEVPLVIIGGGLAGLFTAYTHREHKPVVLEQAARFGGNAKGQSWRGLDYALGSAYIDTPENGTPMHQYYEELGLKDFMVPRKQPDPVEYQGKTYRAFWDGESDPTQKEKYKNIGKFFSELDEEKERAFPFIPSLHSKHLESVKYYDQWSLHELLSKVAGGTLPEQLEAAIEYYSWSTYAGSSKEISASGALNFLAQEVEPILVAAGGNAKIAERLLEKLLDEVPSSHFRPSSLVLKVSVQGDRVHVLYEDSSGKLRKIKAKAAVLSCPKFVANRILENIEPERQEAIKKLKYRSYLTANLLINKPMKKDAYDVFMIGKGKATFSDIRAAQAEVNATDFVMCNFSDLKQSKVNAFTFYCALPYDGARAELNLPEAYEVQRKRFETQIDRKILPLMNLKAKDVVDLRLARWGHALPLTARGIYRDETVPTLRKPFRERVFFIEQDNWAYPSLQTGATDASLFRNEIKKFL